MTVILVLFTFITFLVIDYFLSRKKAPVFAEQHRPVRERLNCHVYSQI